MATPQDSSSSTSPRGTKRDVPSSPSPPSTSPKQPRISETEEERTDRLRREELDRELFGEFTTLEEEGEEQQQGQEQGHEDGEAVDEDSGDLQQASAMNLPELPQDDLLAELGEWTATSHAQATPGGDFDEMFEEIERDGLTTATAQGGQENIPGLPTPAAPTIFCPAKGCDVAVADGIFSFSFLNDSCCIVNTATYRSISHASAFQNTKLCWVSESADSRVPHAVHPIGYACRSSPNNSCSSTVSVDISIWTYDTDLCLSFLELSVSHNATTGKSNSTSEGTPRPATPDTVL